MSNQVKVIALFTPRIGKVEELSALLESMVAPSRAEAGNLEYAIWRERTDPARFVLDELYVDEPAVLAHRASPHYQHYAAEIGELADRTAVVLARVMEP
jgi:quinol monooxygenase YgiN